MCIINVLYFPMIQSAFIQGKIYKPVNILILAMLYQIFKSNKVLTKAAFTLSYVAFSPF